MAANVASSRRARVAIEVRAADGRSRPKQHTIYDSHFGPMLEDTELPWTRERAYAIRDSNLGNNRAVEQYLKFGRAKSVDEHAGGDADVAGHRVGEYDRRRPPWQGAVCRSVRRAERR